MLSLGTGLSQSGHEVDGNFYAMSLLWSEICMHTFSCFILRFGMGVLARQ